MWNVSHNTRFRALSCLTQMMSFDRDRMLHQVRPALYSFPYSIHVLVKQTTDNWTVIVKLDSDTSLKRIRQCKKISCYTGKKSAITIGIIHFVPSSFLICGKMCNVTDQFAIGQIRPMHSICIYNLCGHLHIPQGYNFFFCFFVWLKIDISLWPVRHFHIENAAWL